MRGFLGKRRQTADSDARRTMRVSTIEGCFTVAFMNWTAGSALTASLP